MDHEAQETEQPSALAADVVQSLPADAARDGVHLAGEPSPCSDQEEGEDMADVPQQTAEPAGTDPSTKFPVVAIGASAGGLEALGEFFENVPTTCDMAFIVVTHQHPGHASLLPELLSKRTALTVCAATDGVAVEPSCVYVAPPGSNLAMLDGKLFLQEVETEVPVQLPIDYLFRSLAKEQREQAIGVVLSGTGSDGTLGLKEIKGHAGMVMAQALDSARYSGMPASAIATNLVDYVLEPADMASQLIAYTEGTYFQRPKKWLPRSGIGPALQEIFALLRHRSGHDFSCYKRPTIARRVERRMNVHHFERSTDYVEFLRRDPTELDVLFNDLLIGVTSFLGTRRLSKP